MSDAYERATETLSEERLKDILSVGKQHAANGHGGYLSDNGLCWRCQMHEPREPGFACQGCFEWMSLQSDDDPRDHGGADWDGARWGDWGIDRELDMWAAVMGIFGALDAPLE